MCTSRPFIFSAEKYRCHLCEQPGLLLSGNDLQVCRCRGCPPGARSIFGPLRAAHRITFKDTASCNDVALSGIKFRGTCLRLQSVES